MIDSGSSQGGGVPLKGVVMILAKSAKGGARKVCLLRLLFCGFVGVI